MNPTPARRPDPRLSNLVLEGGRSKAYPSGQGGARMPTHDTATVTTSYERAHEQEHRRTGLARLLAGVAALIFALAVLLYVLWMMLSSVQATGFDADGVRCYRTAGEMTCIKTAEPPR